MSHSHLTAASSSNFQLIFNGALREYERRTKKDLLAHPLTAQFQSANSPESILSILQDQILALDRSQSQSSDGRWTRWLNPTINVINSFSATLGEGVGLAFPPAKTIYAGIGILLSAAKGVSGNQNTLIDFFERIESFFRRLEIYIGVPVTTERMDTIIKIMVEVISILGVATKEIMQGRMKKYVKKLIGRNDLKHALKRFDKLTNEESRVATAEVLRATHVITENLHVVNDRITNTDSAARDAVEVMQQTARAVNQVQGKQLWENIHKWLSPPDPSTNHNIACGTHHEESATWFVQGSIFHKWKSTDSLLWIHGKPGSGKSTLCSTIIQDVNVMCETGLASMAYFYFDFRDAHKQGLRDLVCSFLTQLSDLSLPRYEILSHLYLAHRSKNQPSESALVNCLKKMLTLPGQRPTFLIIDALDESPNIDFPSAREKVLQLLKELVDLRLPNLHICVTSRPEIDIRNTIVSLPTLGMSLHDESGQRKDIADYVRSVVYTDPIMKRWKEEDKELAVEVLSGRADGMFRWVSCQLETLRHCLPSSIRIFLEEFPEPLGGTYERVLREIQKPNRDHARRLLQCLVVATRPLRVEELAEVIAVDFNDAEGIPKLKPSWRLADPKQALLTPCSSLIAIVDTGHSQVVQFSHFSVRQFLTSSQLATSSQDVSRYHIVLEPAHTIMAQACLSTLLQPDNLIEHEKCFPLAGYAAEHWADHSRFGNVSSTIQDGIERLFERDREFFATWIMPYNLNHPQESPLMPFVDPVPLYYAALCGFYDIAERLLVTRPQDINARGGRRVTALHAALDKGHIKVAQLLLQHDADVSARDGHDRTPLHLAAECGNPEVLRSLIDHGANSNAQNKDQETPLFLASRKGRLEAAQLLIEHGADVNHQNSLGRTPLHVAAENGHLDIARLLLDCGADVNAPEKNLRTPLHLAAGQGKLAVAQLLLNRDAEVDVRDKMGSTSLYFASQQGHLELMRLLLEHGADLHARDNGDQTVLHKASEHGDPEVLRSLINHGADPNVQNKDGETPLFLASRKGRLKAARLLSEHGAVNHEDTLGRTPLHVAAENGHYDVARLLLDCGADVNAPEKDPPTPKDLPTSLDLADKPAVAQSPLKHGVGVDARDNMNWTPLHFASHQGHLKLVQLLLEYHADVLARNHEDQTFLDIAWARGHKEIVNVNARYEDGWTALHIASQHGDPELMRWLIDHEGDPHAEDEDQETPLFPASRNGKLEATRLLLDAGADANHRDWQEMTPLHGASENGHDSVTHLLLKHNAEVDARHVYGWTPLHLASRTGMDKVAKNLLNGGARVDAQNDSYWTPLHMASQKGHLNVVELLLAHHADVNTPEADGETALHLAAFYGHLEVVQILLKNGADLCTNKEGETPLDLASKERHHDIAQLLRSTALVRKYGEKQVAEKQVGKSEMIAQ